jgi:hypothetical protein
MGGYFSSTKKAAAVSVGLAKPDGVTQQDKRMCKYRIVYTDRNVKISEHPKDLRAFFVLRRTG